MKLKKKMCYTTHLVSPILIDEGYKYITPSPTVSTFSQSYMDHSQRVKYNS